MAVAFDAIGAGTSHSGGETSWSYTHTIGAGVTNSALIVFVMLDNVSIGTEPVTVKCDGVTMTSLGSVPSGTGGTIGYMELFGAIGLATGSHTIAGTQSGSEIDSIANSISFSGALQTSVATTFINSQSSTTSKGVTFSTNTSGDMLCAGFLAGANISGPTGATSAFINNLMGGSGAGGGNLAAAYTAATGSSDTFTWTTTSTVWGAFGVEIVAGASTPAGSPVPFAKASGFNIGAGPSFQPVISLGDRTSATNATALPGVANVTVTANNPTAAVTGLPGNGAVTVAALPPTPAVTAFPAAANVTVAALAPASTPIVFTTGVASVTVAALAPTPQVTAFPTVANVTVAAFNPSVSLTGNITALPGVANVNVAALAPIVQVTALPPAANVLVAALQPAGSVIGFPGVSNVTVAALAPTPQVTAFPTVANVTVAAFNPSVSTSGNVNANPGVANVTVAAFNPVAAVVGFPGRAAVTVAALAVISQVVGTPPAANVTVTARAPGQSAVVFPTVANVTVAAFPATAVLVGAFTVGVLTADTYSVSQDVTTVALAVLAADTVAPGISDVWDQGTWDQMRWDTASWGQLTVDIETVTFDSITLAVGEDDTTEG